MHQPKAELVLERIVQQGSHFLFLSKVSYNNFMRNGSLKCFCSRATSKSRVGGSWGTGEKNEHCLIEVVLITFKVGQ